MNPTRNGHDNPGRRAPGLREAVYVVIVLVLLVGLAFMEEEFREIIKEALGWQHVLGIFGLLALLAMLVFACTWLWGSSFAGSAYKHACDQVGSILKSMGNLDSLVTDLQKEKLRRELWLSRPWEYVDFIHKVDQKHAAQQSGRHIETITLYGTMVGFAFLLPEALRNHACRAGQEFRSLRLIASEAETDLGPDTLHRDLVHYPIYLVARLVHYLLATCEKFPKSLANGAEFDIEILYVSHDLISAAILLGNEEVAILQALDSKTFADILSLKDFQPGFRYPNEGQRSGAFDRHKAALEHMVQNITSHNHLERWQFRASKKSVTLRITKPHWRREKGNVALISPAKYDQSNNVYSFTGASDITKFVDGLLNFTRTSGSSALDIARIEQLISSAKSNWPPNEQTGCPCRSGNPQQQPIS